MRASYHGLKHLDEYFGGRLVKKIDGDRVAAFVAHDAGITALTQPSVEI